MYEELIGELHIVASGVQSKRRRELLEKAADAIEELQAQIDGWIEQERKALLKSVPKWIPVTERLPKYGTPVLAYGSRGGTFVAKHERARAEWDRDHWWKLNSSIHVCNPTHWMPLPEPPKEGNSNVE